jgi:Protein of unknown function DUF262/Protein of unknown function (DUF1524)
MASTALSPVEIDLEGIGHILRDRRLDVPPYQRGYAWDLEEVEEFWWDLRAAFQASASQYFLGTIVLTSSDRGGSTIIDGQQRSATTLLLFTALRNEFLRRGDPDRAIVIEQQYIVASDLRTAESVPRLTLNDEDQSMLELAINSRPSGTTEHGLDDADNRLISALTFFEERVREEGKNAGSSWAQVLFSWVDFLEHRTRVIAVDVSDEADAFLIFETLNARGRELTVADLLKNYLFGLARDDIELMQHYWLSALESLEASADEEIFATFLRHLWSSLRGATRERELYGRMKAAITSEGSAIEFGRELEDAAPYYAALLGTDHEFWQERKLQPAAATLLRLGLEQNRPLLLAAARNFQSKEFKRLLRAVLSWSVRGLIVGGIGGGTTERAYAEAAVSVSEGEARTTTSVFKELASVIPSDEGFREAFRSKRVNRTRISKYMLIALAKAEEGLSNPAIVSDGEDAEWNLEHVLPRNPDPGKWSKFDEDEIGQWSLRLGNLFVTHPDMTVGVSGPPDTKGWSPQRIVERQEAMAAMVVDLWPRRP